MGPGWVGRALQEIVLPQTLQQLPKKIEELLGPLAQANDTEAESCGKLRLAWVAAGLESVGGCGAQEIGMVCLQVSFLGVPSPFLPGILLSRKPPESQGKRLVFEKHDG